MHRKGIGHKLYNIIDALSLKFDRSMTRGKLLDNNPTLFIFYFYSNDGPRE